MYIHTVSILESKGFKVKNSSEQYASCKDVSLSCLIKVIILRENATHCLRQKAVLPSRAVVDR